MNDKILGKKVTVRGLLKNAKQGDIKSQFVLAHNYRIGRFVDKDEEKAEYFAKKAFAQVNDFTLKVTEIDLFQFRQFDKISVDFDSKITLLVGDNGSGKSTILDALSKSLIWLRSNIMTADTNCRLPLTSDVNVNESSKYTYIDCQYSILDKQKFQHVFSKAKTGHKSSVESEHEAIKLLGDIYRVANDEIDKFNLPLIAFYSIDRSDEIKNKDFKTADSKSDVIAWEKLDGYQDSLKNPQNFANFLSWFIRLDKIKEKSSGPLARLEQLKNDRLELESESKSADESLLAYLNKKIKPVNEEIIKLEEELRDSQPMICRTMLESVISAIRTFIPEIKTISIDHSFSVVDMKINKKGVIISASQLSQGEKSLMALVGDLARRLTMLNPSRDNPLDGNGIVLIDEIDLHLHPSWQQAVIPKLITTFKNIQFILTTHSPQVLSTVSKSNIRVLGKNILEEYLAAIPLAETYAHPNSDVMESVMKVKSIPNNLPVISELNKYRNLLEQGDLKSAKVIEDISNLKIVLEKALGKNHPEMIKLKMVKHRRELLG